MNAELERLLRDCVTPLGEDPGAVIGMEPFNPNLARRQAAITYRASAILAGIVTRESGWTLLFTQRTPDVPVHPGQISFPGGRAQAEDRDIVDTALRETEEEIGVARDFIEPIGTVFQYPTGSGFMITPIVALVRPEIAFTLCAREVAQVIEAPLDFFLDLGNYTKTPVEWEGRKHFYWEIQWQSHRVWGATAGIIQDLASRVAKARSQ